MTDQPTPTQDLVAALGALDNPVKDSKANAGNRAWQYLSLAELLAAVRPVLAAHRIAVMQEATRTDDGVAVETILLHADETVWRSPTFVMPSDRSPHGLKSAVTYARRLSLETMLGIAGDDDDGQTAQQTHQNRPNPRPRTPTEQRDVGAPSTVNPPTDKQIKYLWTLLRGTGMDTEQVREWVAGVLTIDVDWHTHNLTADQVSYLINRLKEEPTP